MEFRNKLIELSKLNNGKIPDNDLKKLVGIPQEEVISKGRLQELVLDRYADEQAEDNPVESKTMMESGEMEDTGQTQQKIRDRIRDKILDPLENSGQLRK